MNLWFRNEARKVLLCTDGLNAEITCLQNGTLLTERSLFDGELLEILRDPAWTATKADAPEKVVRTSRFKHEDYINLADRVLREIARAKRKHPGDFASAHEGFSILKEEVDELWADVMSDNFDGVGVEAIQVAAMAIRIAVEIGTREAKTRAAA